MHVEEEKLNKSIHALLKVATHMRGHIFLGKLQKDKEDVLYTSLYDIHQVEMYPGTVPTLMHGPLQNMLATVAMMLACCSSQQPLA